MVCIFPGGKGTKGGKMKGKVDILNKKTVCSTYFEILNHIEEIVINDRDVLKFVINCRGGHCDYLLRGPQALLHHCLYLFTLSQIPYGLLWYFRYPTCG
jgi:hypothetical protein